MGTLVVNGEGEGNGLVAGSGEAPKLTNLGIVRKDEGEETTRVEFRVDNESLVKVETGLLSFTGGGNSGQEFEDRWIAVGNEEAKEELSPTMAPAWCPRAPSANRPAT
jgi:hypothetical protein